MSIIVTFLLIIILLSRITEETLKVPTTLTIIIYAFLLSYIFPDLFVITDSEFDEILYLMLPVILLPDILNLSIENLKKSYKEIFYLAFVAVVISIIIASLITPYILQEYSFGFGMLVALFSMLMATDAITVTSIMAKFKLPEQLKIYAESESLFNDVTALIIFYFVALPLLSGGEVSFISINITLFKVLLLSTAIGVVVAAFGFVAIKVLKNPFDQFVIIYLVVIVSFLLAEYFHIAGILSIVASVVTFKIMVQKELNHSTTKAFSQTTPSIMDLIKKVPAITKKEFREYKKEAGFIGIFANAVVFIVIANIIVIDHLYLYYQEILSVFIITTLIRYSAIFSMIRYMKLPSRWTQTLTFAGSKGALAIIMSHSLPEEFIHKDMFIAVVIGNVLLSTFIYTIVLMIHFQRNKDAYNEDIALDDEEINGESYTKSLVHMLEKDEISGAYNKAFLEEILSKEIARAQRYKSDMSLLSFRLKKNELDATNLKSIGKEIASKIRMHDFFGRVSENQFVIVTSNTSISGAVVLAEKISHHIKIHSHIEISFGITELEDTDTYETLMEKLSDALKRTTLKSGESVEIET